MGLRAWWPWGRRCPEGHPWQPGGACRVCRAWAAAQPPLGEGPALAHALAPPSWSWLAHRGRARRWTWRLKYLGQREVARWAAEAMAPHLPAGPWLLVAMPSPRRRLLARGHAPTEALARALAAQGVGQHRPGGLRREGWAPSQVGRGWAARLRGAEGLWRPQPIPGGWQGRRVLLVDDVVVTGASAAAAAQALRAAGVAELLLVTMTRSGGLGGPGHSS